MKRFVVSAVAAASVWFASAGVARAEEVKIATYNIEHWAYRFDSRDVRAMAKKLPQSEALTAMVDAHVQTNDKNNWAAAGVIQATDPDVMVFEEGCVLDDLKYFNHRWLQDAYETLRVFPTNTGREQHIGLIAKPGFKVLKTLDEYYKEKDTVAKPFLTAETGGEGEAISENRLFARGPAFVLLQSPGGHQFWVGVNHEKSKSKNSVDVTKWRNREAVRVHQIIKEVEKIGPPDVVFGGDMNDELGVQEFEQEAGGDSVALLQGPPQDGLTLVTRTLAEKGEISFGGYFNTRYRSFIDHLFVTKSLKDKVTDVRVYKGTLAPMASDHYPVIMTLKF